MAAAIGDPLGAGAVGDGCELQKVFKQECINLCDGVRLEKGQQCC